MKRVIILTICVIIIVLIAIFVRNYDEWFGGSGGAIIPPPPPKSLASTYAINDTRKNPTVGKVSVDAVLPLFDEVESTDVNAKSLSDLSFAEQINNEILALFKNYSDEITLFKDGVSYDDNKNDIIKNKMYRLSTYYDRYNNGGIISLVINMDYDTNGLRSNKWKEVFNIDVVNNKKLTLSDLFSSANYKDRIASEINKQAKEKNLDLIEENGINTIPDNQKFYIKDEKLVIYFENSAISKSEVEFTMPFAFNDTLNKFSL